MNRDRGFTLLEVIVALAIAGAALGVLSMTLSGALDGSARIARRQEGLLRARSHLDAAMALPRLNVGTQQGDDRDGYRWRMETRQIEPASSGRGVAEALYAVDIVVLWGSGGQVQLTGRRLAPPAPQ